MFRSLNKNPVLISFLFLAFTWPVLPVSRAQPTRKTFGSQDRTLLVNRFIQMDAMGSPVHDRRLCFPVSILLSRRLHSLTVLDPIRYPVDVAQGTAVPYWAYYNITVSDIFTIR